MYSPELFRELYAHMEWADARVWSELLGTERAHGDERLRDKLFHLHDTQQAFLSLWTGHPRRPPEDIGSLAAVYEWARPYYAAARRFLDATGAETLAEPASAVFADRMKQHFGEERRKVTLGDYRVSRRRPLHPPPRTGHDAASRARRRNLLWSQGDLALALFEYFPDTTSGVALSCSEMAQAGHTLGRLHAWLRGRSGLRDTATQWLALDERRKRAAFERRVETIEGKEDRDEFDRRTLSLLHRRLELLPKAASLLTSLPPLARQVVHGDYNLHNILFRNGELVAVVDFRPPELFLPAFEIGRTALAPELVIAGSGWLDKALAFVQAYCRANPDIAQSDIEFAPHVWAIQLVRSEYGVRQHYFGPLERQSALDRFWFQRCEAAEVNPRRPRTAIGQLRLRAPG